MRRKADVKLIATSKKLQIAKQRRNHRYDSWLNRRRASGDRDICVAIQCGFLTMFERNSNPAFEARRLSSAPGWYVRVVWPQGKREHVPGFVSQREAVRWIEERAKAWLSERGALVQGISTTQRRPVI
jgi:hypothetical protein